MNARDAVKAAFDTPTMVVGAYLGDLSDADLLVRPVDGTNHIAWQLGHLINSERHMIEKVCPNSMPALPEGFAEKHTTDTAALDDPASFYTKGEYLQFMNEQRAGTLAALDKLSDDDLGQPAPESLQRIGATVAGIFLMQPIHWTMHAGQWAVVRRKLGHPALF